MISGLTFKSLIYLEFSFVSGRNCGSSFILLHNEYPIIPVPFIEEDIFSSLSIFGFLFKY